MIDDFIDFLWNVRGFSDSTCSMYRASLNRFNLYCEKNDLSIYSVTSSQIKFFIKQLNIGSNHHAHYLSLFRQFYNYCIYNELMTTNPAEEIKPPKAAKKPYTFYSVEDIAKLINTVETKTILGLRDRTIIELLYLTGLRCSELVNLSLLDIDIHNRSLKVFGKGAKERIIPLNDAAIFSLQRYIYQRHRLFAKNQIANDYLFISNKSKNKPLCRSTVWKIVKRNVELANLDTKITTHTLRHAFGTHLLHNGANLRIVQQLLGHNDITSTQLYTNLPDEHLKSLHKRYHPRS